MTVRSEPRRPSTRPIQTLLPMHYLLLIGLATLAATLNACATLDG